MNELLQLQSTNDSLYRMTPGNAKTPGDVGNGIFDMLLSRINGLPEDHSFGASLYQGKPTTKRDDLSDKGEQKVRSRLLEDLDKDMSSLLLSSSRLVLPESVLPRLMAFLKEQGLSADKIHRMILSIQNKDGSLQVDKLLMQLFSNGSGSIQQEKQVIQSSQIPRVEELLFKMGLGAGEVKEIIENSVNKEGDLVFHRLTGSLGEYYPGTDLKSDLALLLRKHDVILNSPLQMGSDKALDPGLKDKLMRSVETLSPDFHKEIKQNLAVLLRDKGIPPQEVKSFLETIDMEFSRSLLIKGSGQAPEINMLLNHAFLKNQPRWQKDGWHERIMSILKENHIIIHKNNERSPFQEQGDFKLNLAELLKEGDTKNGIELRPAFLHAISGDRRFVEFEKAGARVDNGNRDMFIKDAAGSDLTVKSDHDLKVAAAIGKVKNLYNLPQPLPKVLDRMFWMIRAGEHKSRILIHPPELGRLDLNIAMKNGHLQANLGAESVMVKEIIEANLHQLKQQLSDQGLIVDRFEVMVGLDDGRFKENPMWSWNEQKGSYSDKKPLGKSSGPPENEKPVEKSIGSPYQIDVHV